MKRTTLVGAVVATLLAMLLSPAVASAGGNRPEQIRADRVITLNDSGVKGKVHIKRRGDEVRVHVNLRGLSPNLPHAQHFHGNFGANNVCPPPSVRDLPAGAGEDIPRDLLTTVGGLPFYGPIQVSLTTRGDTSPDSALALDRFPVANNGGHINYMRTFTVGVDIPRAAADNLEQLHYVSHGLDLGRRGTYADSTQPLLMGHQATLPVACGELHHRH